MMKKLRKLIIPVLLCAAIVLSAVGCQSTAPVQTAKTHTISTVKGDIEVPVDPQRVVVNWYIGEAYTLDLNVVGYFAWEHEAMPYFDKFDPATKIENWAPEDVLKLEPDLIITYKEDDFDTFGKIAPVLVIPEGNISSLERVQLIGDATGRSELAKQKVDAFQTKLAAAKQTLQSGEFEGKSFSITEDWGSGSYGIYYETESRGGTLVYHYLGLKKPEKLEQLIAKSGSGRGDLSYEVAAEYFGDYMLWFRPYDANDDVPSEYENSEIWKSLPTVKAGRVVTIPGKMSGLFYYSDVWSLTAQLDYIVDAINAVAGK